MSINPYYSTSNHYHQPHERHTYAPQKYDWNGSERLSPLDVKKPSTVDISKIDPDVALASGALVVATGGLCATIVVAVEFFRGLMGYK